MPLTRVPGKLVSVGSSVQEAPGNAWASPDVNAASFLPRAEVAGVLSALSLLVSHFLREI